MSKFNLNKLKLSANEVLERSQMKKITGGYGTYRCVCSGSVGSWTGTYASSGDAYAAGTIHCASAVATCSAV
jgi:natural product precursor